jgi:hypothetical protein
LGAFRVCLTKRLSFFSKTKPFLQIITGLGA